MFWLPLEKSVFNLQQITLPKPKYVYVRVIQALRRNLINTGRKLILD